ncbi:MAG: hypothetical protein IJ851_07170 [Eubacterium sp.]|nr:hypothetical protein [Eubacterium sp.]
MVQLKFYKVNKLELENKLQNGTQLKLNNQTKYNVNYIDGDNVCIGNLEFRITDDNQNPFELRIEMVAQFTYDPGDDKAEIHTQSFDQIFPFLRQIVHTATSYTGMPGLMIPIIRLNPDTVRVNNKEDNESSPLN